MDMNMGWIWDELGVMEQRSSDFMVLQMHICTRI